MALRPDAREPWLRSRKLPPLFAASELDSNSTDDSTHRTVVRAAPLFLDRSWSSLAISWTTFPIALLARGNTSLKNIITARVLDPRLIPELAISHRDKIRRFSADLFCWLAYCRKRILQVLRYKSSALLYCQTHSLSQAPLGTEPP